MTRGQSERCLPQSLKAHARCRARDSRVCLPPWCQSPLTRPWEDALCCGGDLGFRPSTLREPGWIPSKAELAVHLFTENISILRKCNLRPVGISVLGFA